MAADGSVVLDVNMKISQAEKQLAKLTGDIEKTEREISGLTEKRDEAKQKGILDSAELEKEKIKLKEMQDRLTNIRSMSKDKSIHIDTREAYSAQIPALQQEVSDQRKRVNMLESDWNKLENSVDRYGSEIEEATKKLDQQKIAAGVLTQEIDAAQAAQSGMTGAVADADKYMDRFVNRIKGLARRVFVFSLITAGLRQMRTWLGNVIKTNDEARSSMAQLKGALLTLAQPLVEVIIPAFITVVNVLTRIITAVAQLVSMLFGKTLKQSQAGAKALYNEAEAIKGVGEAADDAAGSLAGFDEINTIQTENAGGGGGGGAAEAIAPDFSFDGDGLADRLKEIADLVALIGAGFALWKIGSVLPGVLGQIAKALGNILMLVGGLLLYWHGLTDAWENGVDWLNLIEMIGGLAAAAFALYNMFGPVAAGIALVVGGLGMLVTAFHDAMENGWNLQNTLLAIAGLLATGLGISLITGSWIPLLLAGIASVLLAITIATGHGEELLDGIRTIMEGFIEFFTGIFTGDIEKAIGGIAKIFDGLETAVGAVISGIQDFFLAFFDWLDEKTNGQFHGIIETAKGFVVGVLETIRLAVGNFADAFEEILTGVVEFFTGVFTLDFDRACQGLVKIFDGICGLLATPFVTAINLIVDALNLLISGLNKIKFDFPDWVPGLGGKSFGVNLPSIPKAKIPRLAQGAVIPANREFMAVLGDQRNGTNLEAPEGLIRQIFREESGGMNAELVQLLQSILTAVKEGHIIVVDGTVFGRTAIRTINSVNTAAGKQLLLI